MSLIEQYGGVHHGYFIPGANPDELGPSFSGLGYDGPTDVAIAMFTFPDEDSYRLYRKEVATDPECITAAALVREFWLLHTIRTPLPSARNEGMK
jgi:hypothetical protein